MAFNVGPCCCEEPEECNQGAIYFPVCCDDEPCPLSACARMQVRGLCGDTPFATACIGWTSGSTFSGTGDDDSEWEITLDSADDCDGDEYGRRIETATVTTDGGVTVTWTWDSERSAYDVEITGGSLSCECPSLEVSGFWVARLWDDDTRPDSLEITFAGFAGPQACCASMNGTFEVPFDSGSTPVNCEETGYDHWLYRLETAVGDCNLTIEVYVQGRDNKCGRLFSASIALFDSNTGFVCAANWSDTKCEWTCAETTVTDADVELASVVRCCGNDGATFSVTLPA